MLDDELVEQGMRLTGAKTKKELVHMALAELVRKSKRKALLRYRGKVKWEGSLDEMRRLR
jgi:Arc/MetJ family transcription regulator